MIKKFVGDTTLHGLRYVFESPTRIRRLIWLILLLASTVMYLYMVKDSLNKYLSYPASTESMEIIPEDGQLKFPAVTICNLNRFVKTKIDLRENNANFYKLGLNLSVCEVIREVQSGLTCGQALLCVFEKFGTAVVDNCSETTKERIINLLNSTEEPVFNPEEFLATYGHDLKAMVLHYCLFAERRCSSDDFVPTLTENGVCYTFNSGRNGANVSYTRGTGVPGGLQVILDVQANENTISEFSSGFRVILHEQETFVNWDNGFNVFPGSNALVAMTAVQYERLPPPHSSACVQPTLPLIANYTKDGCIAQCQANKTIAMCGCRKRGVPGTFTRHECNCAVPCNEIDYESQISFSKFPDVAAMKVLRYKFRYNKSHEYQRTNLVLLQVGLRYIGYEASIELPSYNLDSLLGDIGGNMGLFMGCSLLTLFEFVDLAWGLLRRRMNRIKNTSREGEEATA